MWGCKDPRNWIDSQRKRFRRRHFVALFVKHLRRFRACLKSIYNFYANHVLLFEFIVIDFVEFLGYEELKDRNSFKAYFKYFENISYLSNIQRARQECFGANCQYDKYLKIIGIMKLVFLRFKTIISFDFLHFSTSFSINY